MSLSSDCRQPVPGNQSAASFTNAMGGRTETWKRPKYRPGADVHKLRVCSISRLTNICQSTYASLFSSTHPSLTPQRTVKAMAFSEASALLNVRPCATGQAATLSLPDGSTVTSMHHHAGSGLHSLDSNSDLLTRLTLTLTCTHLILAIACTHSTLALKWK